VLRIKRVTSWGIFVTLEEGSGLITASAASKR
jgi:hypothetical protein